MNTFDSTEEHPEKNKNTLGEAYGRYGESKQLQIQDYVNKDDKDLSSVEKNSCNKSMPG